MVGAREHEPDSLRAEGDITGSRFVKATTTEKGCEQCDTAGEPAVGVAKWDTEDGKICLVHRSGSVEITSAEAIDVGEEVMTSDDGRASVATNDIDKMGKAETATTGADEQMIITLYPVPVHVPAVE